MVEPHILDARLQELRADPPANERRGEPRRILVEVVCQAAHLIGVTCTQNQSLLRLLGEAQKSGFTHG